MPGWPNADADVAKLKGDEDWLKAGVLAPNGAGEDPNGAAGCWPKAPVVPKAGALPPPKAGVDCCPNMDVVVEPNEPPELCPNAGAEPKVPNDEVPPKAGVEAPPKGALAVAPKDVVPKPPASPDHRRLPSAHLFGVPGEYTVPSTQCAQARR